MNMDYELAKEYIVKRLEKELSPSLYYHSLSHIFDVYESATRLADMEDVSHHDLRLLQTAAFYHDAGMLVTYEGHEQASTEIVNEALPFYNYTPRDIERINQMIMATKLPQNAHQKLEKIICDADLDYLGREDFFLIAHRLRLEWMERGTKNTLRQWYEGQIKFLEEHRYFTESAKKLRLQKKMENLQEIRELFNHTIE
ncbi:MAG: HD domain-containing protein [Bacteroidales bacterium]|nr:HD domain-containing protein [Bacteroidales bacterium]